MASVRGTSSMTISGMTVPGVAPRRISEAAWALVAASAAGTGAGVLVSGAAAGVLVSGAAAVALLFVAAGGAAAAGSPAGALFWARPVMQQASSPRGIRMLTFDFMR